MIVILILPLKNCGEFTINNYHKRTVNVEDEHYFLFYINSGGLRFDKGKPELPIVSSGITIPAKARMNIEIIDINYTE